MKRLLTLGVLCLGLTVGFTQAATPTPIIIHAKDSELTVITPGVCVQVEREAVITTQQVIAGKEPVETAMASTLAAFREINDTERYTAVWMVAWVTDYIRENLDSPEFLKFRKEHPKLTIAEAMGAKIKIMCSHTERDTIFIPKRVPNPAYR